MIVIDTHIWLWWVHGDERLPKPLDDLIRNEETNGLGVSAISCWGIALLEAHGRLKLSLPCQDWLSAALQTRGIVLLPLTPLISVEATRLPSPFHRDPADQIIVATARVLDCPLVTLDGKIRSYPHVKQVT